MFFGPLFTTTLASFTREVLFNTGWCGTANILASSFLLCSLKGQDSKDSNRWFVLYKSALPLQVTQLIMASPRK